MYSKLKISGRLEVLSGLHIGAAPSLHLSAADQPLVRDGEGRPVIPASSLKGKLRTLLARALQSRLLTTPPANDPEEVLRLFGGPGRPGRLTFWDGTLIGAHRRDLVEIKGEGAIDRISGELVPRTIERVVPGTSFALTVLYEATNVEEVPIDMRNLAGAMELLAMDALGGHGSRGSGRVAFREMRVEEIYGDAFEDDDLMVLNEVFSDAALNL